MDRTFETKIEVHATVDAVNLPTEAKKLDASYRRKYGITRKQYNWLLERQKHKCGICGKESIKNGKKQRLAVDHDHITGEVRGLLCIACNRALGSLGDSVEGLEKAIAFIKNVPTLPKADPRIPPKPHADRPRKKIEVKTPDGEFSSLMEAAEFYEKHMTTIRDWCGMNKKKLHLKKDGWIATEVFK